MLTQTGVARLGDDVRVIDSGETIRFSGAGNGADGPCRPEPLANVPGRTPNAKRRTKS